MWQRERGGSAGQDESKEAGSGQTFTERQSNRAVAVSSVATGTGMQRFKSCLSHV